MANILLGKLLLSASITAVAAWPTASMAQDATPAEAQPPSAEPESPPAAAGDDTEIVVTANKREQRLTDVGMTISAFSDDTLQERGVTNVSDLARVVPGFTATVTPIGPPVFTLRGVGFYDSTLSAAPAVTVYVDQVPLPYPAMTLGASLDLQRVEVLKGPQGTLFGQNSTGGAINYVAARPTSTFRGGFDLSFGRFNTLQLSGYMSGPISDTLRVRVSASTTQGSDWQRSYTRDDTLGGREFYSARLLADWNPTDRISFTFNVNGWVDRSDNPAAQYSLLSAQRPANLTPALANYPFAPPNARAADWDPTFDYGRDDHLIQGSVRGNFEVADNVSLTSITAYTDYGRNGAIDVDGVSLQNSNRVASGEVNSFFQELRIGDDADGRFRWVLGGNYSRDSAFDTFTNYNREATNAVIAGDVLERVTIFSDQTTRSWAGFGNIEFDLVPTVTLKLGARYTDTWRESAGCARDPGDGLPGGAGPRFTALWSGLKGSPITPIASGGCITLIDTTNFITGVVTGELNEDNISWRAGLDWRAAENTLFYFNVSRGYKAGAFPTLSGSTFVQYRPIPQETVLAYELGARTSLFDRRLNLSGALFYYDYTNKQLRGRIADPVFGSLEALVSIPKSAILGAEFSLNARPFDGFTLDFSATYLDATIDELTNYNSANQVTNFDDTPIPYTPKWSATASAGYRWALSSSLQAFVGADLLYNSRTYALLGTEAPFEIKPFTTLDLRAGVEAPDGHWRFTIWGRNVTNEYYWFNVARGVDTVARYAAQPVTYGATLNFNF